jgi:hypothetical protein
MPLVERVPLTKKQRAAQGLVHELQALGAQTATSSEDATKLRVTFPEGAKKRILQLLRDGAWEVTWIKMLPVFNFAAGNMWLHHVYEISFPAEPQQEDVERRLVQS